jgi:hypothetical protein
MRRFVYASLIVAVLTCGVSGSSGQQDPTGPAIENNRGPACPWNPIQQSLPAGGQCGFNDAGAPNPGIFNCGQVSNGNACVEKCVFVRCQEP